MSRYAADDGRLLFVGNLPDDVRERDIDDIFGKYGRIRSVNIKKVNRPPPFAFVEFDDRRDADDAVRGRDGYNFYGCRLRVEIAKGTKRDRDRGDRDRDRGGRSREFRPRSTGHRVLVKGLPPSASWQDLKDFIRSVVRPVYTNIEKDRDGDVVGIVEFETGSDMDRCIRKLDDTEFKNPFDKNCYVRIIEDIDGGGRGRSRSRSRSPRRGARSPRGARSRSRSGSPAAARRLSRSRSRSLSPPPTADKRHADGTASPDGAEVTNGRPNSPKYSD